jgi:hypothetical protein
MRFNYFFAVFFIICLIGACSSSNQKVKPIPINQKNNFDISIKIIDITIGDSGLDYHEEILTDSNFLILFEHSNAYKEDAIRYLRNSEHTSQQLLICILAMQNLEINDYIDFCEAFTMLYEKGNIPEWVLIVLISPNFLKKHVIIENYSNPKVIKLLERINNYSSASKELKQNVTEILSGQAWNELKMSK